MTTDLGASDEPAVDRQPAFSRNRYVCPHGECRAFAQHHHHGFCTIVNGSHAVPTGWSVHQCTACSQYSIWKESSGQWTLVYPFHAVGMLPNPDMPEEALVIYKEAQLVAPLSLRSAAALLRLALQVIVDGLVPGKGDINAKIGQLVQQGLHPHTQQSMDVLRIVGNNAVHPGQIDLGDNPDLVPGLFVLVNLVVEQLMK